MQIIRLLPALPDDVFFTHFRLHSYTSFPFNCKSPAYAGDLEHPCKKTIETDCKGQQIFTGDCWICSRLENEAKKNFKGPIDIFNNIKNELKPKNIYFYNCLWRNNGRITLISFKEEEQKQIEQIKAWAGNIANVDNGLDLKIDFKNPTPTRKIKPHYRSKLSEEIIASFPKKLTALKNLKNSYDEVTAHLFIDQIFKKNGYRSITDSFKPEW